MRDQSDRPHYGQQIAVLRLIEELILKILTRRFSGLDSSFILYFNFSLSQISWFVKWNQYFNLLTIGVRTTVDHWKYYISFQTYKRVTFQKKIFFFRLVDGQTCSFFRNMKFILLLMVIKLGCPNGPIYFTNILWFYTKNNRNYVANCYLASKTNFMITESEYYLKFHFLRICLGNVGRVVFKLND